VKRKALFLFPAIILLGASAVLTQNFLLPFVYGIKEPFFAMPIEPDEKPQDPAELPIRCDEYGEGWFGAKRSGGRKHTGADLVAKMQSPVYAAKSGWARNYYIPRGYGNLVIINHPGGWQTRYGHLSRCATEKFRWGRFRWVRQGEIIGFIGKTGNADSDGIIPHVHFEIRHNDEPVDPANELIKK
jgi:murein DD-endopeptidase MepM/ murein hydrolase activator NlpD